MIQNGQPGQDSEDDKFDVVEEEEGEEEDIEVEGELSRLYTDTGLEGQVEECGWFVWQNTMNINDVWKLTVLVLLQEDIERKDSQGENGFVMDIIIINI